MIHVKEKHNQYNWVIYLFIFLLYLTTAKGIKIGGSIGIGEIGLLVLSLILIQFNRETTFNRPTIYTMSFWLLIMFFLVIGNFIRVNFYSFPKIFPRTLFAYGFCFLVSFSILNSALLSDEVLMTTEIYIKIMRFFSAVFLIIIFSGISTFGSIDFYWLNTSRFQGLSLDPNQFAIPFIIFPFISLFLYSNRKNNLFLILSTAIISLVVLIASKSDTLFISWISGFVGAGGMYLTKSLVNRKKYKLKYVLLFLILASIIALYLFSNMDSIKNLFRDLLMKDNQLRTRLIIWRNSIDVIKLSPLFGLGPDAGYIGNGGALGEAHNNFFQLGMSAGILGIVVLLIYLSYFIADAYRSKNFFLFASIIALITFGLTHYTLRHPVYWFMFLLVRGLSEYNQKQNEIKNKGILE